MVSATIENVPIAEHAYMLYTYTYLASCVERPRVSED